MKTGIEEYSPATGLEAITALRPKRYFFNSEAYPHLNFPAEEQIGLLAKEVEEVLPDLVLATRRPEQVDSTGTVIEEELDFKAMNYMGLIPKMIAAAQEQQTELQALQQEIAEMRQMLASCCFRNAPTGGTMEDPANEKSLNDKCSERLLRIDPNPFSEQTTTAKPWSVVAVPCSC